MSQQPCLWVFYSSLISDTNWRPWMEWLAPRVLTNFVGIGFFFIQLDSWCQTHYQGSKIQSDEHSLSSGHITIIWVCLRVLPHRSLWKTALPFPLGGTYTGSHSGSLLAFLSHSLWTPSGVTSCRKSSLTSASPYPLPLLPSSYCSPSPALVLATQEEWEEGRGGRRSILLVATRSPPHPSTESSVRSSGLRRRLRRSWGAQSRTPWFLQVFFSIPLCVQFQEFEWTEGFGAKRFESCLQVRCRVLTDSLLPDITGLSQIISHCLNYFPLNHFLCEGIESLYSCTPLLCK